MDTAKRKHAEKKLKKIKILNPYFANPNFLEGLLSALYHRLCLSAPYFVLFRSGAAGRENLRIGFLDSSTAFGSAVLVDAFRQGCKLGWIEGKNILIEYRFAEQKPERLPELAADLVRLKVDLIVVIGEGRR